MENLTVNLNVSRETFDLLFQTIALTVQILGIYFVVVNLRLLKNQLEMSKVAHQDILKWNKKVSTENELANKPNIKVIKKLTEAFGKWENDTIPLETVLQKLAEDKTLEGNIAHLLNRYERLSRGVLNDFYDENIVSIATRGRLMRIFKRYENYINHVRSTKNEGAWTQYGKLVMKWENECKKET